MAFRSSSDRRAACCFAVVALAMAMGTNARADGETEADALLRRGVELRRAGHDAEALDAFKRANAASPSPRALAQSALAEQALSLWIEADKDLNLALGSADDPWIRQHRDTLDQAARVIAGRLGWVSVQSNVPTATLYLNGRSAGPVSQATRIRVLAGDTAVELRQDGREPIRSSVRVTPEQSATVTLHFPVVATTPKDGPAEPPQAPVRRETPRSGDTSSRRWIGWGVAGIGVAGIAVGSVFGVRAIHLKSERDDECRNGCTQKGVTADRDGRSAGTVSTIGFVGGLVAVGVGLTIVLLSPADESPPRTGLNGAGWTF